MGLLRTILIIICIYYAVKILSRLFAPFLVKYVAKKAEKQFGQQFGDFHQNASKTKGTKDKVGETVIDKIPNTKSSSNTKVGEYIDFEEVD